MSDHQEKDEEGMDEAAFEPEPIAGSPSSADRGMSRAALLLDVMRQIHASVGHAIALLEGGESALDQSRGGLAQLITGKAKLERAVPEVSEARIIEGIFDGIAMTAGDGKTYVVPPNYASKSRLVEGDVLKLTIRADGSFVYKQIGPIERKRLVGAVAFDWSTNSYLALCDGQAYKVLTASVTYFKGQPGDEIVILVPRQGKSVWAAVENVMKK